MNDKDNREILAFATAEIPLLLDFYGDLLTEKMSYILRLFYEEDLGVSEIAELVGSSRQSVHDTLKRANTSLLEYEDKLGLVERHLLANDLLNGLSEAIKINDQRRSELFIAELKELI